MRHPSQQLYIVQCSHNCTETIKLLNLLQHTSQQVMPISNQLRSMHAVRTRPWPVAMESLQIPERNLSDVVTGFRLRGYPFPLPRMDLGYRVTVTSTAFGLQLFTLPLPGVGCKKRFQACIRHGKKKLYGHGVHGPQTVRGGRGLANWRVLPNRNEGKITGGHKFAMCP